MKTYMMYVAAVVFVLSIGFLVGFFVVDMVRMSITLWSEGQYLKAFIAPAIILLFVSSGYLIGMSDDK